MDVGHLILGRPWIYDLDVTNFGRTNICVFNFKDKKVKLHPLPPKDKTGKKESGEKASTSAPNSKTKGMHILNASEFQVDLEERTSRGLKEDPIVYAIWRWKSPKSQLLASHTRWNLSFGSFRISFLKNCQMNSHQCVTSNTRLILFWGQHCLIYHITG